MKYYILFKKEISQALLVKHEDDLGSLAETEEKYNYLLNQEAEYKEIIDKTVSLLEEEKSEKDRISLERSELKNVNKSIFFLNIIVKKLYC